MLQLESIEMLTAPVDCMPNPTKSTTESHTVGSLFAYICHAIYISDRFSI